MSKKSSSFLRHLNRNRKAPRSTLRVEPLESRQLWAVVEGAGTEVVSNVTNSDGVTYDQVLMTGDSVTVTNDAGQVTRVSYLDNDGDIVQVALVGPGKLNVTIPGAVTGVAPSNYNAAAQAYNYVQGDATITVSGPIDESSSLEVYSVGAARNGGVVDATHQGGDHWADISRVIIVGNEQNEAGYTNFGNIRTGNAFFSASSGVVGIRAENIAVQGVVRIGDIDATESGVPTLYFNSNSQFQNVFVQGGDLKQSNGASFNSFSNGEPGAPAGGGVGAVSLGGFSFFNSINGGDSQGNLLWSQPVNQDAIRMAAVDQQTLMAGEWVFTLDASGKVASALQNGVDVTTGLLGTQTDAQASLDAAFDRRTFTGDITIIGDLKQNLEINIADARGDVTFNDDLLGRFIVDGYGAGIDGTLTVMGNLDGAVLVRGVDRVFGNGDGQVNPIHAIVVEGSTGTFADIRAEEIGDVTIRHNFSGILSTNVAQFNGNAKDNTWSGTARTGTGYVDVDGKIGNVTIGQALAGTSNGGSIVNGTIQGMSGIGNVWVGGDVWGSSPGTGVFVTASNNQNSASPTDVRNYGSANIGTITVHGDVDLDQSSDRFIHIAGNGTFGNILVEGKVTMTENIQYGPGPDIPDPTVPYTDARWLSVFAPGDLSGSKVWTNQDSNGSGPGGNDYVVGETTAALVTLDGVEYTVAARPSDVGQDLPAGGTLAIFRITAAHPEGEILTGVQTEAGDKLIPLAGGVPIKDVLGNYVFQQNNIAAKAHMIPGPDVAVDIQTVIHSGNRGNLDGVYNNFGRIEIAGLLGAQQATTGSISWTDSVDMDFGGITVNSSGNANQNVIASVGTIGQITITNNGLGVASKHTSTDATDVNIGRLQYEYTSFAANGDLVVSDLHGHRADLHLSGTIGVPAVGTTNASTAFAGLAGLKVAAFEDVLFDAMDINGNATASIIATKLGTGVDVQTINGLGNGTGVGTISPSVIFNSMIYVADGTTESGTAEVLKVVVGTEADLYKNSLIQFNATSGIIVTDGSGRTGQLSALGDISLAADYVNFQGTLQAGTIGNLALTGGMGIRSTSDTAVNFQPVINANTVGTQTFASTSGKLVINETVAPLANTNAPKFTSMGDITATSAYGDIAFGGNYQANLSKITLSTADIVDRGDSGLNADKIGWISIDGSIAGDVGAIKADTTGGNIANTGLFVGGNAQTLDLTTGVSAKNLVGAVQKGNINFTETINGTRGISTLDTATKAAGSVTANFNYAGAFNGDAAVDSLVVKTATSAAVTVNVTEFDDNANGVIAGSEIGHGGNIAISSLVKKGGDIALHLRTTLTEAAIHSATLGNVTLTGNDAGDNDKSIAVSFAGRTSSSAFYTGGFEGGMGDLKATIAGSGGITYGQKHQEGWTSYVSDYSRDTADTTKAFRDANNNPIAIYSSYANFANSVINGSIGNVELTGGTINFGDNGWQTKTSASINSATNVVTAGGADQQVASAISINGTRGKILSNAGVGKLINGSLYLNGAVDVANLPAVDTAFEANSHAGDISLMLGNTSGDVGNVKLNAIGTSANDGLVNGENTWTGGNITLANNVQAKMGNVDLTTHSTYTIKNGAVDQQSKAGNITITGNVAVNKGTWGNVNASTDVGTITMSGMFGTIGDVTFATTTYIDKDFAPNTGAPEPISRVLEAGNITLGGGYNAAALGISGTHGKFDLSVAGIGANVDKNSDATAEGVINGTVIYSGAQTGTDGIIAKSETGDIQLKVTLANDAGMSADGSVGAITLTSAKAGDIKLDLLTQNSAAGDYKKVDSTLAPAFTVGAITATTGDWNREPGDVKAGGTDNPWEQGDITITGAGVGAWANPLTASIIDPNYSTAAIFRGTVAGITATTASGAIGLSGDFGKMGDITLTTGQYVDSNGAKTTVTAGDITVGSGSIAAGFAPLGIWGESGTVKLTTNDKGGTETPADLGTISGSLRFAGKALNATSLDASSARGAINLKVFATGLDLNGDGRVTDGVDRNITGPEEFAVVRDVKVETTDGGNVTFAAGLVGMDGSKIGPSIGAITLTANDDILIKAETKLPDNVITPNVTFTGMTSLGGLNVMDVGVLISNAPAQVSPDGKGNISVAGKIGDVTMTVASGTANLKGNFVDLGAVTIATGTRSDSSFYGSGASEVFGGNIKLGDGTSATSAADLGGFTNTLNIAGTYESSTLTVVETGIISGSVFVAGTPDTAGNDWTLTSARGWNDAGIDVGFVAGFNADGAAGIEADETGKIGAVVASSTASANVFVGVGGQAAASIVGNVTVSTGDVVNKLDGKNDFYGAGETSDSGDAKITGLSSAGLGTVGDLKATVATGTAGLDGRFGNVGSILFRTDAFIDIDSTTDASEEPIVANAGDIDLNSTQIWGTHGLVDLKTVDTSKLAAGKAAIARGTDDLGNIDGVITFSGGLVLPAGNTDGVGFSAVSDRGDITVTVAAGIDEADIVNATVGVKDYSGDEAGTVGNIVATSTDGDITLDIPLKNIGSTIGTVKVDTGDTWQVWNRAASGSITAKYDDDRISQGTAKVLSTAGGYGTVGAITVTTDTGMASVGTFGGAQAVFGSVGTIKVTTDKYTDSTLDPALPYSSAIVEGGDISANLRINGTYGNIELTTVDNDSSTGDDLGLASGKIEAAVAVYGAPVAGSTIKALTQQGAITLNVSAEKEQLGSEKQTSGRLDDNGKITDWLIGTTGAVDATSSYGTIATTLTTGAKVTEADNSNATPTIGNVTLKTNTSWDINSGAGIAGDDLVILNGAITITGASAGKLGNITGNTGSGLITVTGSFDDTVGAIKLTADTHKDNDGTEIVTSGNIVFGGTFAALTSTKVETIDLTTKGAGTITIQHVADVAWHDDKVDAGASPAIAANDGIIQSGEQRTFSSGKLTANSVDGKIDYSLDIKSVANDPVTFEKEGYASLLDATSLKTSGTGVINITGSELYVADITAFSAETTGTGAINFTNASKWEATKITSLGLTATDGNITTDVGTTIGLNFANSSSNKTTSASIESLVINAKDGNVILGGAITAFDNGALPAAAAVAWAASAGDPAVAATADNRTFAFKKIEITAANGVLEEAALDGNIALNGLIGGKEVTSINELTFTTMVPTDDAITLTAAAGNNILAHDIGALKFAGNTVLTGGSVNILADDAQTTRQVIGTANYSVASSAILKGIGANLDTITSLTFNGSVRGGAATLTTSSTAAEIRASSIGSITVNAPIHPSFSFKSSVQDLDVLVTNGTGEWIDSNSDGTVANKFDTVDAYKIGNVSITHGLQVAAAGTSVFAGSSVFSSLGGLGNLTIKSTNIATTQAPLFDAVAGGNAIFAIGDGDANVFGATSAFSNLTDGTAVPVVAGVPTAKISVGAVSINAGQSNAVPVPPPAGDIGGAGGLAADEGFVLAVAVHADGVAAAGTRFLPGNTVANDATVGARLFTGYVTSVSAESNASFPDTFNMASNGLTPIDPIAFGGAIVVAGQNSAAANTVAAIGDIVNETTGVANQPLTLAYGADMFIIGDEVVAGGNFTADDNNIVVYVR